MKHRYALLLAVPALIVIALGAFLASEIRTLPGAPAPATVTTPSLQQAHRIAGYAVAILTLGLAIWASNLAGLLALGTAFDIVFVGVPAFHALNAQILFSLVIAIAVQTSKSWQEGPQPVESQWKPLRPLGMAIPLVVFLQIALGAELRHGAMNVIWHILNAMIVLLVVLVAGVFVLRQYPEHPVLRPAALTLVIVTGVQVLLGFSVYLIFLMSENNNAGLIITGVLHVINGALTLAASVVLALQVQRNLIQLSGA
jgi:heme A synthase